MDIFTLFKMMDMASIEHTDIDWGSDYAIDISGATLVPNGRYFYIAADNRFQRFDGNLEQFTHALVREGSTYHFGEIVYGMAGSTVSTVYTHVGHDVSGAKDWTDLDGNTVQLTLTVLHQMPQ